MTKKEIDKFMKQYFSKEERAFIGGAALGTGIMTGYIIVRGIRKVIKREAKINEVADNAEIIIDVIMERFLEKRGIKYGKETK